MSRASKATIWEKDFVAALERVAADGAAGDVKILVENGRTLIEEFHAAKNTIDAMKERHRRALREAFMAKEQPEK